MKTDKEVCKFIDKHVTCELPNKRHNPKLHEIVTSVQMHSKNHTKSCRKYSTVCRLNFPRPPVLKTFIARTTDSDEKTSKQSPVKKNTTAEEYGEITQQGRSAKQILKDVWTILSAADSLDSLSLDEVLTLANVTYGKYKESLEAITTKNTVYNKRPVNDCWVNNYNKYLLFAWNANMDIQFVTYVYSCVAYILSYINKAEGEMSNLLLNAKKEAQEGSRDAATAMKHIAKVYMNNREVSAQEAVYRVCLKLKDCSREVRFIPNGTNSLKMSLPINVIKSRNADDENIWMTTVIEKYYARPLLEDFDVCLAEFCSKYTICSMSQKPKPSPTKPVYELQRGLGYIQKKQSGKESIVRYPRFSVKKSPEEFFLTLIQLYLQLRSPFVKPPNIETFEDFVKYSTLDDGTHVSEVISVNRKKFELEAEELDKAWDDLQQGNAHPDAWAQIAPETESERLEIDMDKQPEEEVEVEHLPELDNEGDDAEKPHFRVRKAKDDSEESADIDQEIE